MKKKNFLLITSDQQRWDALGCFNSVIKTPNLDRLAARGIAFERAYTCNPVCTPARVSLLTGHYPSKHGCYTIGTGLPEDYPTMADFLSKHGYFTALIGKAHFQPCLEEKSFEAIPNIMDREFFKSWNGPYYGFEYAKLAIGHSTERHAGGMHYGLWLEEQGVDVSKYFGNTEYTDYGTWQLPEEYSNSKWTADETIKAIQRPDGKDEPFLIWTSFQDPHNPCFVSEPWASMYKEEEMPVYGFKDGEMDDKPPFYKEVALNGSYQDLGIESKNWYTSKNIPFMDDDNKRRKIMTKYYGMISQMDYHIGRIIDCLEEKKLLEDTVIVFTSDHGDYMGNHGLWWKGLPAYEDAQKIPFIVVDPKCVTQGQKSSSIQSLVDVPATFLAASGLTVPAGIQGINQEKTWKDNCSHERDWAMIEFRPTEASFMQKTLVTHKYKLVVYHNRNYGEIYDLEKDPNQYLNLWDKAEYINVKMELLNKFISVEMEKDGVLRERVSIS